MNQAGNVDKGKNFERGLYPSIGIVVVRPIYGICIVGLITELADIKCETVVGFGLHVDLTVAPLGLEPGIPN